MRQIRFRGRSKETGEWEYGSYAQRHQDGQCTIGHFISGIGGRWIEVDPATVGQFVDLPDKNGYEICEGDIVRKYKEVDESFGYESYEIRWNVARACFEMNPLPNSPGEYQYLYKTQEKCEVIGNIYENSNLLTPSQNDY